MPDSPAPLVALITADGETRTGAASGIGLALARSLLARPPSSGTGASYAVLLVDLSPARLQSVAEELAAEYGAERVDWTAADVTDYAALAGAFERARGRWGRVDAVLGIAGITEVFSSPDGKDPFLSSARLPSQHEAGEVPKPPSTRVIDVNLKGVLNTVHLAIAHFRANPPALDGVQGKIVVAGSAASIYPFPNESLYGAAKHGVLGLVRSLAPTLLPEGITINAIAPSIVATGIGNSTALAAIDEKGLLTPMETVTRSVTEVLLERDEAAGRLLTGQILELCLAHTLLRLPPRVANDDEQKCLEVMWPWREIEASVLAPVKEEKVEGWLRGRGVEIVRE
ncbi:hypothetical protein JCM8097_006252 [Rhodosporidiobolus ruineniae]